jgi:putative oxidoreductase
MEAKRQDLTNSVGLLILRVGVGGFMATHGWGKLQMLFRGDEFADPIGLGSGLSLFGVVMAEFFAAILVIIGLGTRVAAALPVFAMLVAAFVIHANDPWTMNPDGGAKEPAMLFLIPFLALIFTGAGKLSVDGLIWPAVQKQRAKKKAAGK